MLIDAKNPEVAAWYAGYGALPLLDAPLTLLLPLDVMAVALGAIFEASETPKREFFVN